MSDDPRKLVEAMKGFRGVTLEQGWVVFIEIGGQGIHLEPSGYGREALDKAIELRLVKPTKLTQASGAQNPVTINIWERVEAPEPKQKNGSNKAGTKERYKSQDNFRSGGHKPARKKPPRKSYIRKRGSK